MSEWQTAKTHRSAGVTADLYFSRRMAAASVASQDPLEKVRLAGLAIEAGGAFVLHVVSPEAVGRAQRELRYGGQLGVRRADRRMLRMAFASPITNTL